MDDTGQCERFYVCQMNFYNEKGLLVQLALDFCLKNRCREKQQLSWYLRYTSIPKSSHVRLEHTALKKRFQSIKRIIALLLSTLPKVRNAMPLHNFRLI